MKTIYAATDFSEVSKNAVIYAAALAKVFNSKLSVLNVYESPLFYTAEMPYTAIEAAENLARNEAEEKMKNFIPEIRSAFPDVEVNPVIKRGISIDTIIQEAHENKADLLVAGATGAGMIERTLIGSTTTALINKSNCLVLIVPENAKFNGISKLVYTTDLNDDNILAANDLLPVTSKLNAELTFLFVDSKIHTDSEEISEEMAAKIKKHVKYPKISGYVCTDVNVMNGISLFLQKMNAEMVAMLTHPRSFPRMLWDKSLTTKFSYHPDVPLLVMHAAS